MSLNKKTSPIKYAFLIFILSFIFVISIFTIHFFYKFSDDIFGKNCDALTILKMFVLTAASFFELSFPISLCSATLVYFRQQFKNGQSEIRLKKLFLMASVFAICAFLWSSFASPVIYLHQRSLLFDISQKKIDEPLERLNISYFVGGAKTFNYFQIFDQIDLVKEELAIATSEFNAELNKESIHPEHKKTVLQLIDHITALKELQIHWFRLAQAHMIGVSLFTFIVYLIAVFMGILFRNFNLILIFSAVYLIIFPCLFILWTLLERLAQIEVKNAFLNQFYFLAVPLVMLTVLYILTRKQSMKQFESTQQTK